MNKRELEENETKKALCDFLKKEAESKYIAEKCKLKDRYILELYKGGVFKI